MSNICANDIFHINKYFRPYLNNGYGLLPKVYKQSPYYKPLSPPSQKLAADMHVTQSSPSETADIMQTDYTDKGNDVHLPSINQRLGRLKLLSIGNGRKKEFIAYPNIHTFR